MLRIDLLNSTTLRMSGRLEEGCRQEVESFLGSGRALSDLVVDLSEATFIDREGEAALCWLGKRGAKFTAENSYAIDVCERLGLALTEPSVSSASAKHTREGARHG